MSDVTMIKIIEDLSSKITQLDSENQVLKQLIISILVSMPKEQASFVKSNFYDVMSLNEKLGSARLLEVIEIQKSFVENVFSNVK